MSYGVCLLARTGDASDGHPTYGSFIVEKDTEGFTMPSHIYFRVGRYADASKANSQASAVDEEYIAQCRTQGIYPLTYYPHNLHFLYSAASFEGNSELTILAAEKVAAAIPHHVLKDFPMLQGFLAIPELALARFGRWEQVLKRPAPAHDTLFLKGMRSAAPLRCFPSRPRAPCQAHPQHPDGAGGEPAECVLLEKSLR